MHNLPIFLTFCILQIGLLGSMGSWDKWAPVYLNPKKMHNKN